MREVTCAALLVAALALFVSSPRLARADESGVRRLGLDEAVKLALEQSPALAVKLAALALAKARLIETEGLDDTTVEAASILAARRSEEIAGQSGFQTLSADDLSLRVGAMRPLRHGGRVGLRLSDGYQRTSSRLSFGDLFPAETFATTVHSPQLAVTLFQPLLRGLGVAESRGPRRLAAAELTAESLEHAARASAVVRDVVQAYWELAFSTRDREIRGGALELAREQLRVTVAAVEGGKLAPTELRAVEQAIATREELVLLAEVAVSERSLELRQLVGLEIGPGVVDLVAADEPRVLPVAPDVAAALAAARERNPELVALAAREKSAAIEIDLAERGQRARLDLDASFGPAGNDDALGGALGQVATFASFAGSVGISYSAPVENRAARGRLAQARARRDHVRAAVRELESRIAVAVVRSANLVRSAQKRLQVTAKASALAEANIGSERARWEVGRATSFDLLRRQDELAQAQLAQARARTDYLRATAALDALTGVTFDELGARPDGRQAPRAPRVSPRVVRVGRL